MISRLVAKGVGVTPVVLHTGVASLGSDEMPYAERVRVPRWTADRVNRLNEHGGRVIAIGHDRGARPRIGGDTKG